MVRGLNFRIWVVEGLYYPYSENKGADQLRGYRKADLRLCFRICKKPVFSQQGSLTAVSGVGSSPGLATCETSQVLLAGVSGGFPGVLPFRPPIDWLVSMSEIILKGTLN